MSTTNDSAVSKLKQSTASNNMLSASQKESSVVSAYTAYNAVDDLVAKPVFGSDGAKKWQSFATESKLLVRGNHSVAPTAPLKSIDRASGFTSWKEERDYSNQIRKQSDDTASNTNNSSLYTHFTQKQQRTTTTEISSKERKRIERRIIGDHQVYFIPSLTFDGWKFDYIFTTKNNNQTGYYFDGTDSIKVLNGQISKDDIPLSAKVLSIAAPSSTSETVAVVTTKKRSTTSSDNNNNEGTTIPAAIGGVNDNGQSTTKKRKTKAKAAPIIVNNPNHPLEQIAAILAQRQQSLQINRTLLPNGWEVAKDSMSGKDYYYNRSSGERTWELPSADIVTTATGSTVSTSITTTDAWNVTKDPNSGKEYYYNSQTGETSWEKPTGTT